MISNNHNSTLSLVSKHLLSLFLIIFSQWATAQVNQLPAEISMRFSGPMGVPATMQFTHTGTEYRIYTRVSIPFNTIEFKTEGVIEKERLLPLTYEDRRGGKRYAYASFDYGKGQITYGRSGEIHVAPLKQPTKDFFSLAWEMALHDGALLDSVIATNGKKLYTREAFPYQGERIITVDRKRVPIALYQNGQGDDRIELGFMRQSYTVPAVIAFYDRGRRYELTLTNLSD